MIKYTGIKIELKSFKWRLISISVNSNKTFHYEIINFNEFQFFDNFFATSASSCCWPCFDFKTVNKAFWATTGVSSISDDDVTPPPDRKGARKLLALVCETGVKPVDAFSGSYSASFDGVWIGTPKIPKKLQMHLKRSTNFTSKIKVHTFIRLKTQKCQPGVATMPVDEVSIGGMGNNVSAPDEMPPPPHVSLEVNFSVWGRATIVDVVEFGERPFAPIGGALVVVVVFCTDDVTRLLLLLLLLLIDLAWQKGSWVFRINWRCSFSRFNCSSSSSMARCWSVRSLTFCWESYSKIERKPTFKNLKIQ